MGKQCHTGHLYFCVPLRLLRLLTEENHKTLGLPPAQPLKVNTKTHSKRKAGKQEKPKVMPSTPQTIPKNAVAQSTPFTALVSHPEPSLEVALSTVGCPEVHPLSQAPLATASRSTSATFLKRKQV